MACSLISQIGSAFVQVHTIQPSDHWFTDRLNHVPSVKLIIIRRQRSEVVNVIETGEGRWDHHQLIPLAGLRPLRIGHLFKSFEIHRRRLRLSFHER
jgi:hypothetical protein